MFMIRIIRQFSNQASILSENETYYQIIVQQDNITESLYNI